MRLWRASRRMLIAVTFSTLRYRQEKSKKKKETSGLRTGSSRRLLLFVSRSSETSVQTRSLSPSSKNASSLPSPPISFHLVPAWKSFHLDTRTLRDLRPVPARHEDPLEVCGTEASAFRWDVGRFSVRNELGISNIPLLSGKSDYGESETLKFYFLISSARFGTWLCRFNAVSVSH